MKYNGEPVPDSSTRGAFWSSSATLKGVVLGCMKDRPRVFSLFKLPNNGVVQFSALLSCLLGLSVCSLSQKLTVTIFERRKGLPDKSQHNRQRKRANILAKWCRMLSWENFLISLSSFHENSPNFYACVGNNCYFTGRLSPPAIDSVGKLNAHWEISLNTHCKFS